MGRAKSVVVLAVALVLASCDSSAVQPSTAGSSSTIDAVPTTQAFVADTIPTLNQAADQGCLDEAGNLHAHVRGWYPGPTGSPLGLNGERTDSAKLTTYVSAAAAAVAAVAPGFTLDGQSELHRRTNGCATHRYATFSRDDDKVVVATWRLTSAADPFWVPNEAPFTAIDDHTIVSDGGHIAVVLVVAPDGTTSRVSAYGPGASDLVAGWPSTFAPNPSAGPVGATPMSADALMPIATAMLDFVLHQR